MTTEPPSVEPEQPIPGSAGRARRIRWSVFFASALAGLLLTFVAFIIWKRITRPPLSRITSEQWEQARQLWTAGGYDNYDMEIAVQGPQAARYAVVVRDGAVISAKRNDQPLTQRRTWETWSVDGMFDTIASDLRRQAEEEESQGAQIHVMGAFDPEIGLPRRYLRIDRYPSGGSLEASWNVTRFDPQPPERDLLEPRRPTPSQAKQEVAL